MPTSRAIYKENVQLFLHPARKNAEIVLWALIVIHNICPWVRDREHTLTELVIHAVCLKKPRSNHLPNKGGSNLRRAIEQDPAACILTQTNKSLHSSWHHFGSKYLCLKCSPPRLELACKVTKTAVVSEVWLLFVTIGVSGV